MKRLPRPRSRYSEELLGLSDPSERRRWTRARNVAVEQAALYARVSPRLRRIAGRLSDAAGEFFYDLYDSERAAVTALKERVRRNRPEWCPYCGLNEPPTLDHYLERQRIPELAVYPRNLVPCCWPCNHMRGRTFTPTGERRILHFYDDDIDALPQLLVARITFDAGDPVTTFSVTDSAVEVGRTYATHFDTLNLKVRYERLAPGLLAQLKERARRNISRAQLGEEYLAEAAAQERVSGRNEWKAAVLRAAATQDDVMEWITA